MNLRKFLKPFWQGLVPEPFNYLYVRGIPGAMYGTKLPVKQNLLLLLGFFPIIRNFFAKSIVTERIVENPFVIGQIARLEKAAKILDFGCYSSILPLELASLGYQVVGVDLCDYPYKHPNFSFYQMDILDNKFKSNFFDCIYAVSSLEHVGVGWYPQEKQGITDSKVVKEFYGLLKPKGRLIVTVPFGKRRESVYSRIYDKDQLLSLFSNFVLITEEYFLRSQTTVWKPSSTEQIIRQSGKNSNSCQAVACLVFKKVE